MHAYVAILLCNINAFVSKIYRFNFAKSVDVFCIAYALFVTKRTDSGKGMLRCCSDPGYEWS